MIAEFDGYWNAKCRADRLPARASIDPAEFRSILPNVILLDVERDPLRMRIRLVGTRIVQFRGDNTGRYLHELESLEPARLKDYLAEMRTVCERGRPAFARDAIATRFGGLQEIFVGIWPLATDGHTVDKLVVIEDYGPLKVWQLQHDADF